MLVGQSKSVRSRVLRVLALTLVITVAGILLAALGALLEMWAWPPQPSSTLGVVCGFVGGALILFEMAILPRKWFRGTRLGRTKWWMKWHIVLGLVCLPVILVHAGFGFGGSLPAVTMILFLLVIASGIWGLVMQQWLPQKMLTEIPNETVATEIDFAIKTHVLEAIGLVEELLAKPGEQDEAPARGGRGTAVARIEPLVIGGPARELVVFRDGQLLPYLERGRGSRTGLVSRTTAERQFARLRSIVPDDAFPQIRRLEELCDLRRQWDVLRRIHVWLHNWLLVHLPLSVAMTVLMIVHAVRALKYW